MKRTWGRIRISEKKNKTHTFRTSQNANIMKEYQLAKMFFKSSGGSTVELRTDNSSQRINLLGVLITGVWWGWQGGFKIVSLIEKKALLFCKKAFLSYIICWHEDFIVEFCLYESAVEIFSDLQILCGCWKCCYVNRRDITKISWVLIVNTSI